MNIGGIANLTFSKSDTFLAYDVGPGNCLMDCWSRENKIGNYDDKASWSASVTIKQYLIETCQRGTVGDDPAGLTEHTRNLFYADNFFLRHKPIRARTQISWPKSNVNYRNYGSRQSNNHIQTSVTGRPDRRSAGNYHRGVKYPRTINRKLHLGPWHYKYSHENFQKIL